MVAKITVVGGINMDMVTHTDIMPKRGETLPGNSFTLAPGGKGANQAVAASRLGADVVLAGCVGNDNFGKRILENLGREDVNTAYIRKAPGTPTGVAQITIVNKEKTVIVVPGANGEIRPGDMTTIEKRIQDSDVVLLQLEIPLDTVTRAAQLAKSAGVTVILNPAPFHPLPPELLLAVDYITPNEIELDYMMKRGIGKDTAKKVIVTKGKIGTQYYDGESRVTVPSYSVEIVDTTGAGDAFNAALAYSLASRMPISDAVIFANAAGALSVRKIGAQRSLPTLEEVEDFIQKKHVLK